MDIEKIKQEVLNNKKIIKIIEKNNLTDAQIEESIPIFFDIIEDAKIKDMAYTSEIEVQANGRISRKLVPTAVGQKIENKNNFILRDITVIDYSLFPSLNDKQDIKSNEFM
jgi:hypothetical protein